jgi:hypothetical protein
MYLISSSFGLTNHYTIKNDSNVILQSTKTTLTTVFGSITTYTCKDGPPSNNDVLSYLKQIAPIQYSNVVDNIQIDSIGSGIISFSAVQYSRTYTGSESFNYVIPTKVSLSTLFGVSLNNQTANINDVFDYS